MEFLRRIQEKPPAVRAQYAFLIAAILTALIGLIWLTALPARFADIGKGARDFGTAVSETIEQAEPPMQIPDFSAEQESDGALDALRVNGESEEVPTSLGSMGDTLE